MSASAPKKNYLRAELHPNWKGDDAGYKAIHEWMRHNLEKSGSCSECGKAGSTQWAFLRHPERHTRVQSDYREMCAACHVSMDAETKPKPQLRTHCRRGHEYTAETTRITSAGSRQCRICLNASARDRYHARKRESALKGARLVGDVGC